MRRVPYALAAAVLSLTVLPAAAQAQDEVRRVIQSRQDIGQGKEMIVGTVEMPAETPLPRHVHAGEEMAYVLEGVVELRADGREPLILRPGDSFIAPRGLAHGATAKGGPAKVLAVWVIDLGQPIASPAP